MYIRQYSTRMVDRQTGLIIEGTVPTSILNKFHIPADHYLKVPLQYLDLIIEILQSRSYVYKTAPMSGQYVAIAVQFQRG